MEVIIDDAFWVFIATVLLAGLLLANDHLADLYLKNNPDRGVFST